MKDTIYGQVMAVIFKAVNKVGQSNFSYAFFK